MVRGDFFLANLLQFFQLNLGGSGSVDEFKQIALSASQGPKFH